MNQPMQRSVTRRGHRVRQPACGAFVLHVANEYRFALQERRERFLPFLRANTVDDGGALFFE